MNIQWDLNRWEKIRSCCRQHMEQSNRTNARLQSFINNRGGKDLTGVNLNPFAVHVLYKARKNATVIRSILLWSV